MKFTLLLWGIKHSNIINHCAAETMWIIWILCIMRFLWNTPPNTRWTCTYPLPTCPYSLFICMGCNVSNYKRNQLIFIISLTIYLVYLPLFRFFFFALLFATDSVRYLLFTSPRRMSECVVNLNELPPCLTFPFWQEKERDRRRPILYSMPGTSQFLILINLFAEIAIETCSNFVRVLRLSLFLSFVETVL